MKPTETASKLRSTGEANMSAATETAAAATTKTTTTETPSASVVASPDGLCQGDRCDAN
jgi:hypothetical protein